MSPYAMTRHVRVVSTLILPTGFIEPCIPIAARAPPSGPGWLWHEIKHDGYRLVARLEGRRCACSPAAVMTGPTAFLASVRPWRVCDRDP